ncbi:MAG: hypothetical protein ACK48K_17035, partial [Planctomycetota bacterium]
MKKMIKSIHSIATGGFVTSLAVFSLSFSSLTFCPYALAQDGGSSEQTKPVFVDGVAQVVEGFKSEWVEHDLFVQTEFDSDNDGKLDRVHVSVT